MNNNVRLILNNCLTDAHLQFEERGFQMGLLYIATYAINNGYNAKIFVGIDCVSKTIQAIELQGDLPIIGFYVSADNLYEVERACLSLKNWNSDLKIILGGPEASVDHERLLENNICEFVCIGDGEECVLGLLQHFNGRINSLSDIPGLAYLDPTTGKTIVNSKSSLGLDNFPIPMRELYDPNFVNLSNISTARGCASQCAFCFEGIERKLKSHSLVRIIEEITYLNKKFNQRYISFIDDTFTTVPQRVYSFCEEIEKKFKPHEELIWYCEARVSDVTKDENLVKTMVRSGLARMQFGSESGNQKILNIYKKK